MAVRGRRRLRGAFPRAAARGADLHAAGASALFPGRGRGRQAAAALHHRQQHRKPRPREGARRQRARRAAAPRRTPRSSGTRIASSRSRRARRGARRRDVPGEARLDRRQGAPRGDAGRRDRAADRRGSRQGRARGRARQVRPAVRRWSASSPSCRASWAATTRRPTASRPKSPRRSTSTICRAARAARCRAPAPASPWRWPTSSTRWPASSRSARSRAARRIRSACGAPPSASLRILIEKKLDLDLRALIGARRAAAAGAATPTVDEELWDYIVERLRAYLLDAASAGASRASPPRCSTRCAPAARSRRWISARGSRALVKFLALPEAASLTAANKRIANILRKAEGGDGGDGRRRAAARAGGEGAARSARRASCADVERALAQARLRRGARQARHAASRGRRVLRRRDGQRRGSGPAAQPPRAARAVARVCSRASPICPACPADTARTMQWLGSDRVHRVHAVVDAVLSASSTAWSACSCRSAAASGWRAC